MDAKSPPHSAADGLIGKTAGIRAQNRHLLFSFNGRANRQQYWLGSILPPLLFSLLNAFFDLPAGMGDLGFTVVCILLAWISLAIAVKRCHDQDWSGWFLLIGLIPVIGFFWLLWELGFSDEKSGENRFGPPTSI